MDDFVIRTAWDQSAYAGDSDPAAWLLIELEPRATTRQAKVPADLVLVLDVSGSMRPANKYPLVRQGLLEFTGNLAPEDRIGIVIFSEGADTVLSLGDVAALGSRADALLQGVEGNALMFGNATRMAPGLAIALDQLDLEGRPDAVRRVYALTDGELHDHKACVALADRFAEAGAELHIYGFGDAFDVEQIATLSRRVPGGTCKPLVNTEQVVATFRYLGNRAANLVARNLQVTVRLAKQILPGDAFRFRPHPAWLGPIRDGVMNRLVPSVEMGRIYSYLLEMRLPPQSGGSQKVASVTLTYDSGNQEGLQRESVTVRRGGQGVPDPQVQRARDLCLGQREHDPRSQLAAAEARLELALAERRDPGLLKALRRQIEALRAAQLSDEELAAQLLLEPGEVQQRRLEIQPSDLDWRYLAADEATDAGL